MARIRSIDLLVYSIPASIAVAAGFFAWSTLRSPGPLQPGDSDERPATSTQCVAGRHECKQGGVYATTGEDNADGKCVHRDKVRCKGACVSELVTLRGVDDTTAGVQLCDLPSNVSLLVSEEKNFLRLPASEAKSCSADGFGPTAEGVQQCILRSGSDPNSTGMVVATMRCRFGVIASTDTLPRLVSREQAIAIWCRREGDAGTVNDSADSAEPSSDAQPRTYPPWDAAELTTTSGASDASDGG